MRQLFSRSLTLCFLTLFLNPTRLLAQPDATQLSVWANEAVVATYTYDYQNFITQQRNIAKYFTADGWTGYSAALNTAQLPQMVQKNSYFVSSVALLPIKLTTVDAQHWQAKMPLLVLYKNPQYQQKQTLDVTIQFTTAPSGQGVRGLAITSLKSEVTTKPCQCK